MKDYTKNMCIENTKLPKVKGHTRIELTNVKTGEKKIIEHDNVFQADVIAKQLRSFGVFANTPWRSDAWKASPLWENLCGGIFLFRDAIDTTNGDVDYMPAGNKMIGNASVGTENANTPVEMGSFNEIESSTEGNDSLTLVFDWGTSQGNGTIGCVCLTSKFGGYVGYGNASGDVKEPLEMTSYMPSNVVSNITNPYKNRVYRFSVNGHTLTVEKRRVAITEASLFDQKIDETIDLTFTGDLNDGTATWWYYGGGKYVFCNLPTTLNNNASLAVLVYDADNDTVIRKVVTNTTGETLKLMSGNTNLTNYCYGLFSAIASSTNAKTETAIIDVDNNSYEIVETAGSTNGRRTAPTTPELLGVPFDNNNTLALYDPVNNTLYKTNSTLELWLYNDWLDAAYFSGAMYKNPLYLATVNNLQTPVVKDNTQTMKVIYTLTEA